MPRARLAFASLSLAAGFALGGAAAGQSPELPPGFVAQPIGSGWSAPAGMAWIDARHMLVAERRGSVWLVVDDVKQNKVLDLSFETLSNGDRGLLGIAVHPDFAENGYLYLLLVVDPNLDGVDGDPHTFSRLVRYETYFDDQGFLREVEGSRVELLGADWSTGIPSCHLSHTVGALRFLSDGSLVLATGDGAHYDTVDAGGYDAPCFQEDRFSIDQDIGSFRSLYEHTLAGKVLRLDPLTGAGLPDNPHFDPTAVDSIRSKIWVKGLRNPFRMAVVPGTGPREALLIGDVGWNTWEEIDLAFGGESFGWPCYEGASEQPQYQALDLHDYCDAAAGEHVPPILAWHHSVPGDWGLRGVCVSGLAVYTGDSYPPLYRDRLFFTDFGVGFLKAAKLDENLNVVDVVDFGARMASPVDLEIDPATGDLVFASLSSNVPKIYRIRYVGSNQPPLAHALATPAWGAAPLLVELDATGSLDPEGGALSYEWKLGDGTTSTEAELTKLYDDPTIDYRVVLEVTDPEGRTGSEELLITPGNTPPRIVEVSSPRDGAFYRGGQPLELRAFALDDEDDLAGVPLQASWHLDLVDDHTVHPDWVVAQGFSAVVVPPSHGTGTNRYRVTLRVSDSRGLVDQRTLSLYDADARPEAHLVQLSDATPRLGQAVAAVGHVHFPGPSVRGLMPDLVFDWGDGAQDVFPRSGDQIDATPSHVYARAGDYQLTVSARLGADVNAETALVRVERPRPAVAVFAPLLVERWVEWPEHEAIAESVRTALEARGVEVAVFHLGGGADLAQWMAPYLDDGVRDVVVLVDYVPTPLYAGQPDGSLAEEWLEHGNGIVWTGQTAFFESLSDEGDITYLPGDESNGADLVLDAAVARICRGTGSQVVAPGVPQDLPSLTTYVAHRALRYDQLGAEWSVERIFAEDTDADADAVQIRHVSGGFYAQFHCSLVDALPRAAVITEFLTNHLGRSRQSVQVLQR